MTFRPGFHDGNDSGDPASSGPWPSVDASETWLTGSTDFGPGFWSMQFMEGGFIGAGTFYFGYGGWGQNAFKRAYNWVTAKPNRKLVFRIAPGFAGGTNQSVGILDLVAAGSADGQTQQMVQLLFDPFQLGNGSKSLIPYVVLDPYHEGYGGNYEVYGWGNQSGDTSIVPAGDRRVSWVNAYRRTVTVARAKLVTLGGVGTDLKFGWSWAGDVQYNFGGLSSITGGYNNQGAYPGDDVVDYLTPDWYTDVALVNGTDRWQQNAAQVRNFALAHGKKIVVPEFGCWETDSQANAQSWLTKVFNEFKAYDCYEGWVYFNVGASDGYHVIDGGSRAPATYPALVAQYKSQWGVPLVQGASGSGGGGTGTAAFTHVVVSVTGTTVTIVGNVSSTVLNVVAYEGTHDEGHKLAEVAPVAGAFTIVLNNQSIDDHSYDLDGYNVPAGGSGSIIATVIALTATVAAAPTLAIDTASTSGLTRNITLVVTGPVLNVVASENDVKLAEAVPSGGSVTLAVPLSAAGSHTIDYYGWSSAPGDPGSVLATTSETFTIIDQPSADSFDGTTLNTGLWTVRDAVGDGTVAVANGALQLGLAVIDLVDDTTRADDGSVTDGPDWGYTVAQGSADLHSNAIRCTDTAGVETFILAGEDLGASNMLVGAKIAGLTLSGTTDVEAGVFVRNDAAGGGFYVANIAQTGGHWNIYILKYGAFDSFDSVLATSVNLSAPADGDIIELEIEGATLTAYSTPAASGTRTAVATYTDASPIGSGHFGGIYMKRATGAVAVSLTDIALRNGDHQNYVPEDRSLWIYQAVGDGDYTIQLPISPVPSAPGQVWGLNFQADPADDAERAVVLIYVDANGQLKASFLGITDDTVSVGGDAGGIVPISTTGALHLRVQRVGDEWTYWASGDKRVWNLLDTVTFATTVAAIGPFIDNHVVV